MGLAAPNERSFLEKFFPAPGEDWVCVWKLLSGCAVNWERASADGGMGFSGLELGNTKPKPWEGGKMWFHISGSFTVMFKNINKTQLAFGRIKMWKRNTGFKHGELCVTRALISFALLKSQVKSGFSAYTNCFHLIRQSGTVDPSRQW